MFSRLNVFILASIAAIDLLFLIIIPGGFGTLFILITQLLSAAVGIYFYRLKNLDFSLFFYVEATIKKKERIVKELWDEWLILFGACIMIVPGFFSDILGILLLIPDSRKLIGEFFEHFLGSI